MKPALPFVVVAVAIAVSGCGGSNPIKHTGPSTSTAKSTGNPTGAANVRDDALRFAECVRAHGVPNFPDPNADGVIPPTALGSLKGSPKLKAAVAGCKSDLPAPTVTAPSSEIRTDGVRFAACMRAHGISGFPDPGSTSTSGAASLDPSSPQFRKATRACRPILTPLTSQPGG